MKSGLAVAQGCPARPAEVWQGGDRRTAAQRVFGLGTEGETQFNRDIMKPQIFERFEWRDAVECFEWYLEMCRDARGGLGQFQENLSEVLKAGAERQDIHHLSGQGAGVSTVPGAQLCKTAPPNPGSS